MERCDQIPGDELQVANNTGFLMEILQEIDEARQEALDSSAG